jgi:hypothetical protein
MQKRFIKKILAIYKKIYNMKAQMKTKTKTNTGWIIRDIKTGRYFAGKGPYNTTTKLENAGIVFTRSEARQTRVAGLEVIHQVILNDKFVPTKIIGGNGSNCIF